MKFKNSALLLLSIVFMVACTSKGSLLTAGDYPAWRFPPGFRMADLLAKKAPVHDQQDIQALLNKPWYSPIKLINLQTQQVFIADRCSQILPDITHLETYRPSEYLPFLYQAAMCVAAESIAKAPSSPIQCLIWL